MRRLRTTYGTKVYWVPACAGMTVAVSWIIRYLGVDRSTSHKAGGAPAQCQKP